MIIKKIFEDYEIRIEPDSQIEEFAKISILYVGDYETREIHGHYASGSIEELLSDAIDQFIVNVVLTDRWKTQADFDQYGRFE